MSTLNEKKISSVDIYGLYRLPYAPLHYHISNDALFYHSNLPQCACVLCHYIVEKWGTCRLVFLRTENLHNLV